MIVLSFILVLVAAVTLIVGFFQDTLAWIYVSIGACVAAMVFLAIGWMQRRSATAPTAAETGYGPGAATAPTARPAATSAAPRGEAAAATRRTDGVTVVPKKSTGAGAAAASTAGDGATTVVRKKATASAPSAIEEPAAEQAPAKKATKKAPTKKAATKKAPAKKAAAKKAPAKKAAAKKAPAKKKTTKKAAGGKTTGKAARDVLSSVKGLGPAKIDALLKEFGSLEDIKGASPGDLAQVKGVGDALAKEIQKKL